MAAGSQNYAKMDADFLFFIFFKKGDKCEIEPSARAKAHCSKQEKMEAVLLFSDSRLVLGVPNVAPLSHICAHICVGIGITLQT